MTYLHSKEPIQNIKISIPFVLHLFGIKKVFAHLF